MPTPLTKRITAFINIVYMYMHERCRDVTANIPTQFTVLFVFNRQEKEEEEAVVVVVVGVGRSYALAHTCRQNIRSAVRHGLCVYALCAVSAYTRFSSVFCCLCCRSRFIASYLSSSERHSFVCACLIVLHSLWKSDAHHSVLHSSQLSTHYLSHTLIQTCGAERVNAKDVTVTVDTQRQFWTFSMRRCMFTTATVACVCMHAYRNARWS